MRKRRNKLVQKRVTLRTLLLRALAAVLTLTAVFSVGFQIYLTNYIDGQCSRSVDGYLRRRSSRIGEIQKEYDRTNWMPIIHTELLMTGSGFGAFPLPGSEKYGIDPGWTPNCYGCAVLTDEQGNLTVSNRRALAGSFAFSSFYYGDDSAEPESDSGFYLCDPLQLNIPELTQLFDRYDSLLLQAEQDPEFRYLDEYYTPNINVRMEFTSAYVNRETHTFIPYEGALIKYVCDEDYYSQDAERFPVCIDIDLPGYDLVKICDSEDLEYPCITALRLYGVKPEVIDEFGKRRDFSQNVNYTDQFDDGKTITMGSTAVIIDQQRYLLSARIIVDYAAPPVVKYFCTRVLLFAAGISLLALLWCLWKNQKNKLRYAMEDYQRALTDNLAHDIKTPLMAISGYAENIRDGSLPEAKQKQYVGAIIENVSYTDALVSRTLRLNHMGETKQGKPEEIAVGELVGELLRKYELLIEEKQITYSIDGGVTVQADPAALETILENLISNAVKYTPEGGIIQIKMDKKTLTVTNTVTQKLDVRKLKEPFVRGDGARSNVKGNGLGLAIADRAAKANGFKLKLSCTDTEFQAELRR